jgi:alpha-amylase/alpha-mannosidase (GH57 family)
MTDPQAFLVVHAHFYQPPRANPWTGRVEREISAHPWHDWNERITAECYRPNAFSHILGGDGRILATVNNYGHMSFDLGPTLAGWLAREAPETYERICDADRQSAARRSGHGNGMAQAHSHAILPLMTDRDRRTQIRWGRADFRARFGRQPEGMWLPEAAVDDATLDALIDEGIRFSILSPHQAGATRPLGQEAWAEVSTDGSTGIDPTRPYRRFHGDGSGRFIDLCFYDADVARAVAFDRLLARSSADFVSRFLARRPVRSDAPPLLHTANDGESYGHHTAFGDRTAAYALTHEAPRRGLRVSNYAEYLERHPPIDEVRLRVSQDGLGTSWSCPHGLGRWTRDCGCRGGDPEWSQAWRAPLRAALDLLRDRADRFFEDAGEGLGDPWAARDGLVEWTFRPAWREQLQQKLGKRLLALLEMQLHGQLMYASCGWFHSDVGGLETRIVLRHAGRALSLWRQAGGAPPESDFLATLAEARSNRAELGTGADLFLRFARSEGG